MDSHEKYLELCAASTAGELSVKEELSLDEHLANCASCRRAKYEFESAIEKAIPALERGVPSHSEEPDANWSIEKAEAAFFERLRTDKRACQTAATAEFERLAKNVFPKLRVGLLHGRLKNDEKDSVK